MNHQTQVITAAVRHADFKEILRYRFVFDRILLRDIRTVVGSTAGDYISLLLKPLFLASIIGFLKSRYSQQPILLSYTTAYYGLLLWWMFADNAKAAISVFKRNRPIITKIYVPKGIFVLAMFGSRLYGTGLQVMAGAIFLCLLDTRFDLGGLAILLATFFTVSIFSLNFCLGISVLAPKYRAIRTLAEFMLFSLFFTMPVTFNVDILGGFVTLYFLLNPMGSAIAIVKNVLSGGAMSHTVPAISLVAWTAASFLFVRYFSRQVEQTVEAI